MVQPYRQCKKGTMWLYIYKNGKQTFYLQIEKIFQDLYFLHEFRERRVAAHNEIVKQVLNLSYSYVYPLEWDLTEYDLWPGLLLHEENIGCFVGNIISLPFWAPEIRPDFWWGLYRSVFSFLLFVFWSLFFFFFLLCNVVVSLCLIN